MWAEWAAFAPTQLLGSAPTESDLLEQEKESSRMLHAMRNDHALSTLILQTVAHDPADQFEHCLLLPQNVTLGDVSITQEFVETHLVQLQRAPRGQPRSFTSLNGLCGTCQPDNTFVVHARLRHAKDGADVGSSIGGWQHDQTRGTGTIPQLESTIYILRAGQLQATSELPLSSAISLLLISDPLFFPGCGWKLPLALRKCTHRFRDVNVTDLALSDLPQLLFEYQILARAWLEHRGDPIKVKPISGASLHSDGAAPEKPPGTFIVADSNDFKSTHLPKDDDVQSNDALNNLSTIGPEEHGLKDAMEAQPVSSHAATLPAIDDLMEGVVEM